MHTNVTTYTYVCTYVFYIGRHYNLDILNCMINNHNCSQLCLEVEGLFNCTCYPGYELQQDRVTCTGTGKEIQIH